MELNKNVQEIFAKANAIREQAKTEIVAKNKPVAAVEQPTPMPSQNKIPTVYVGLSGILIKEDGTITKDGYLRRLQVDNELYANMKFTEEEIKQVAYAMKRQSSGINSAVPLKCTGDLCAFKNSCQPGDALVLTAKHGYVEIKNLNSEIHRIVSYARDRNIVLSKVGYNFTLHSRLFDGNLIKITTESGKSLECTPDHISIATWNEHALNKFCVYLMKKGDYYRIGKTFLLKGAGGKRQCGDYRFGPRERLINEKADAIWVLGVYETNTEALLAEEVFSCKYGISKALFIATDKNNCKYDGMYTWITQSQLDLHHESLKPSMQIILDLLKTHNLDFNHPIYMSAGSRDDDISFRIATMQTFKIRSANLISNYMNVIIYKDDLMHRESIKITYKPFKDYVYSLDVAVNHTYISNEIITHNCPYMAIGKPPLAKPCLVEAQLIHYWTEQYLEEFNVDPHNITEMHMVSELAEFNIYEMRVTKYLAENHPTLMQDFMVGVDPNGNVISNQDISRAYELKDRIKKSRMKVLDALMATRKEKLKIISTISGSSDSTSKLSDLKNKIMDLSKQVGKMQATDAEFTEVN